MTRIRFFGAVSDLDMENFAIIFKAEDIKKRGYKSRYSEQTEYLRGKLGERAAVYNDVWGRGW